MSVLAKLVALGDVAILVHPDDNVAVVRRQIAAGVAVRLSDGEVLEIGSQIAPGHRFAVQDIEAGTHVIQYGHPIGTSLGIKRGEAVQPSNMNSQVPTVRYIPEGLVTPAPDYIPEAQRKTFMGFHARRWPVGHAQFHSDYSHQHVCQP